MDFPHFPVVRKLFSSLNLLLNRKIYFVNIFLHKEKENDIYVNLPRAAWGG